MLTFILILLSVYYASLYAINNTGIYSIIGTINLIINSYDVLNKTKTDAIIKMCNSTYLYSVHIENDCGLVEFQS